MDAPTNAAAVKQQIQEVKEADDRFIPPRVLPVLIDYSDRANPFELAQDVVYDNGIVRVLLEKGFKWDGASIPVSMPLLPWILTMIAMHLSPGSYAVYIAALLLLLYTLRLLPYMQKIGKHYRAMCVHDKLYRAQKVARIVADAIMYSILESDGIPWDVRMLIYGRVRNFGWIAWALNKRKLRAMAEAAKDVSVSKVET